MNGGKNPRRTSLVPLAFPCFVLCPAGVETEGLLDYQVRAGIISIVRWNLRPVIFGVKIWPLLRTQIVTRSRPRSEFQVINLFHCREGCGEVFGSCGGDKF